MTHSEVGDDDRVRNAIVDALRRYGADAGKVNQLFSAQHDLQPTDLRALVAIMSAERRDDPLTPGRLRQHLGLSSAGTSYVIDRLVESGHVERRRDHPTDNRIVHLHYTPAGRETAMAFFRPLGARTHEVMDSFSPQQLAVIARFLDGMAEAMAAHIEEFDR